MLQAVRTDVEILVVLRGIYVVTTIKFFIDILQKMSHSKCPNAESNHGHMDFQSIALPTELFGHSCDLITSYINVSLLLGNTIANVSAQSFSR